MSIYEHAIDPTRIPSTRREWLNRTGTGLGSLALGMMFQEQGLLAADSTGGAAAKKGLDIGAGDVLSSGINPLSPKAPQFAPRAKRMIHIFANGGPSHVDTFDRKQKLQEYSGKTLPNPNLPTERRTGAALGSPFKWSRYGESGMEISDLFENLGKKCADELCVIRSMRADVPNHEPSLLLMNCGDARLPRPSMGSWLLYGLGTENQNLPGFVVMCPGGYPIQESQNWQSAFLPGIYQGTYIDTKNTAIEKLIANIRNKSVSQTQQAEQLDLLRAFNADHAEKRAHEAALEARIQSFELAFRMQTEAAEAFDTTREPKHIQEMYGPGTQARQYLTARRLLERGVRYVQVWHGEGQPWDNHDDLESGHRRLAKESDQGLAALIVDLKQRGMLEDTLVVWGGEFGRTPTVEMPTPGANAGKMNGRDHNHHGFTMWVAGGGIRKGYVHGATDEFGFQAVDKPVHVHDLHATLLKLLGFDHEKFTYRYAGRDFRLTDVHGNVVQELIG